MQQVNYKQELLSKYHAMDVDGATTLITKLVKSQQFPTINRQLVNRGRLSAASTKVEDVAAALISEIEEGLTQSADVIVQDNYFDIAEQLKRRFNKEIADIYIRTKTPDEFLLDIRTNNKQDDDSKVSEDLVKQYKRELVRIEEGRKVCVDLLQKHSHFPIKNVKALSELFKQLNKKIRSNYRYLSIKPYFTDIIDAARRPGVNGRVSPIEASMADNKKKAGSTSKEITDYTLFPSYLISGEEPSLAQQIRFRVHVAKLFQILWDKKILSVAEHKNLLAVVSRHFAYRGGRGLARKVRCFFEELIHEINTDHEAILKCLARIFIDEYRTAEQEMYIRHGMIETELAQSHEYIKRLTRTGEALDIKQEDQLRVVLDKIVNLEHVIKINPIRAQTAETVDFYELERAALGISALISSSQITGWIRIYSILFSNKEFLAYSDKAVDFSVMRKYISDLTTYHLSQNVAEMKLVVDRTTAAKSDDNTDYFKHFGDVLKTKLQGLMGNTKEKDLTFQEMISDLSFLDNQATQFVIADTFKGFQGIAGAFNDTANDYFVRDRDVLLKESQGLYDQICAQCLNNIAVRPKKPHMRTKDVTPIPTPRKSWFGRIFS